MAALHRCTAAELAARLKSREATAENVAEDCLARIADRDRSIFAWHHIDPDQVRTVARALDRGPRRGPLHGVPIGVKDIIDTADQPTEYGSPIYRGHRRAWDAWCVALARRAGALVMGKTVTTEFAYYHPGKTRNPRNTGHTPGGSSSGSAAAVADTHVPLAFGSQTAGSVIRPASFCGIVGFKPSHGWHSLAGVRPLAHSLDTLGWFGRGVADVALLRTALLGREPAEMASRAPPRIGYCETFEWQHASPATRTAMQTAAEALRAAGATVAPVALPEALSGLAAAQRQIMAREAAQAMANDADTHADAVSQVMHEFITEGQRVSEADYRAAQRLALLARQRLRDVFAAHDILLVPAAPGEAPAGLDSTGDPIFNRVWTLLHLPAVTIPTKDEPGRLPVGIQLVGDFGDDERLLAYAGWAERALADPDG